MQIKPINNQTFSAKTKQGNEYQKSNTGKMLTPLVMLGATALAIPFDKTNLDGYLLFKSKEKPALAITASIAVLAAIGVGIGAIVDAISNKTMRKDADEFAKTGEVQQNTNKGKKICAGIGLLSGIASVLFSPKRASDFIDIPRELIAYTALGFMYDNTVNAFRDKLNINSKQ